LSKIPSSGLDFEKLTEEAKRAVNNIPAMLYHGVSDEPAVLMRINSVPRSIAGSLGETFASQFTSSDARPTVREARQFLRHLTVGDWQKAAPKKVAMSGEDYRDVWRRLSGEIV
jgi:hypothetical protein